MSQLDVERLEQQVKEVYRDVAEKPDGEYHFETGRPLAERLGYDPEDLEYVPDEAIDSFAGVGYHFDLAELEAREDVLDLGCGSGADCFVAALHVTETGTVTGVDITDEQIENARRLAEEGGFHNVRVRHSYIEELPFEADTFDAVISNGVINLSSEKERVFAEAARVLKPGGRLALSDILSEKHLPERIKSNEDLWAACIGGAMQIDRYTDAVEDAGFTVTAMKENDEYHFTSDSAANACDEYGIKSLSLVAELPE